MPEGGCYVGANGDTAVSISGLNRGFLLELKIFRNLRK
jgi:hypothetical protein